MVFTTAQQTVQNCDLQRAKVEVSLTAYRQFPRNRISKNPIGDRMEGGQRSKNLWGQNTKEGGAKWRDSSGAVQRHPLCL